MKTGTVAGGAVGKGLTVGQCVLLGACAFGFAFAVALALAFWLL